MSAISSLDNQGIESFHSANVYFDKGKYEEAISKYIKAMQTNKKMYEGFIERGIIIINCRSLFCLIRK